MNNVEKFLDDVYGFAASEEEAIRYADSMMNSDDPMLSKLDHKTKKYINDNIKKYYSGQKNSTSRSQIKTFEWFDEEDLPDLNWVCATLGLRSGPVHILNAFSNVGKTFFAADLAVCVANNLKLFDMIEMDRVGKVLHIDWDQGEEDTKIYYWKILNGHGLKRFNNINYLIKPDWNLVSDFAKEELISLINQEKYILCIIDCLGAGLPGQDLNDDRVRKYTDMLGDVSSTTGCAILLLHHEPKNTGNNKSKAKNVKGSGSIIASAGGSLHLTKNETTDEITLELGKRRLTKEFKMTYILEDVGEYSHKLKGRKGIKLSPIGSAASQNMPSENLSTQLLKLIEANPEINLTAIRQNINGDNNKIDKALNELHESDFIKIEGTNRKKHTITESGKQHLLGFGSTNWKEKSGGQNV